MTTIYETSPGDYTAEWAPRDKAIRAERIAGMRAMCNWLEANPDAPAPLWDHINVPLHTNAAVEAWANEHGMRDLVKYDNEGNASLDRMFGSVAMHVYGYTNFAEHCDRTNGRTARQYAAKHGLALVATENGGAK